MLSAALNHKKRTPLTKLSTMIRFTIATVCYNAGHLIGRTIKSVESQNHPGVEHLIIDGNSQDACTHPLLPATQLLGNGPT